MNKMRELQRTARRAMKNAYAPYSKYKVGAALLTRSGKIYPGCNIENGSYGLTICAERAAIFNAIIDGHRQFEAIAVTANDRLPWSPSAPPEAGKPYPCGACLQVMAEFAPNMTIIIFGNTGKTEITTIKNLLPNPFKSGKLMNTNGTNRYE